MTQEDKDLLLKDLCTRLPYGVKAVLKETNCYDSTKHKVNEKEVYSFRTGKPLDEDYNQHDYYKVIVTDIKPYLFPLSSMTEEQKNECFNGTPLEIDKYGGIAVKDDSCGNSLYTDLEIYLEVIEWLLKNHFDIYGLISKGIAIDATGLNIY